MSGGLVVEREGAVAILTLDRPAALNAFDTELTGALQTALRDATADASVRAVLLTGAGRAFSAGQDLRDRAGALDRGAELRLGDELRARYHPIVTAIRRLAKPVIAAVNGVVAGAGLGIACACDIRVAAASATFRAAWSQVGLVPDGGAAFFLPRIVGWGRAHELALTGRPVASDEALAIGLVSRVWPDDAFARESRAFAADLATGATLAYALTKRAFDDGAALALEPFLVKEAAYQDEAGRSHDYVEGLRAFREKRPARFTGS